MTLLGQVQSTDEKKKKKKKTPNKNWLLGQYWTTMNG